MTGDDDQWRFSVSDLDGEESDTGDVAAANESDRGGGNVAGSLNIEEEINAGEIDTENALFVLLGVALAVLVLAGFLNLL